MSKFYLMDNNYSVFTGFEFINNQKMYCYNNESDFRKAKYFKSIEQILTYFKRAKMPLFPTQHKVLEYTQDEKNIYHQFRRKVNKKC